MFKVLLGLLLILVSCKDKAVNSEKIEDKKVPYPITTPAMDFVTVTSASAESNSASSSYFLVIRHKDARIAGCTPTYLIANSLIEGSSPSMYSVTLSYYIKDENPCSAPDLSGVTQSSIEITKDQYDFFSRNLVKFTNEPIDPMKLPSIKVVSVEAVPVRMDAGPESDKINNDGSYVMKILHRYGTIPCNAKLEVSLEKVSDAKYFAKVWVGVVDDNLMCPMPMMVGPQTSTVNVSKEFYQLWIKGVISMLNPLYKEEGQFLKAVVPAMKLKAVGYDYVPYECDESMIYCPQVNVKRFYLKITHRDDRLNYCSPVKSEVSLDSSKEPAKAKFMYKIAQNPECQIHTALVQDFIHKVSISEDLYQKILNKQVEFVNPKLSSMPVTAIIQQ